ncbi:GlxA family transcriptional regulator [Glycomyces terrestris]|uniref:Helix-turn-helix domain-containing protein n=1 Tax=Glycomyces terrestris TaxID=2493553 RepID=A0A426UXN1_9ACTN|nr:helix-turn-helix domain-containing protein [Glycomyces terrestris]RRR99278.1 helix-turn-helix domain-containing protein [Glycomyces terrestris]
MSLHRVAALVQPPQAEFELASAAEVFGLDRPRLPSRYEFTVCTEHPGIVPTKTGWALAVTVGLEALETADTVLIPAWSQKDVPSSEALLGAVRAAHARGARMVAICTGAFLLAEAGLLEGRRATTHWRYAAELAARYPGVDVDADALYVDEGDIATSAGTAAGIDLCLHLVRSDHGAGLASRIARHMVMPPHREGGQRQYAVEPVDEPTESLGAVLEWAAERLHEPLSVEDLAERGRMSARTLARRFDEQLGTSPGQWLLSQRIAAAQALLEDTDLPVESIAVRVGLSSALNLRRRFRDRLGTTPAAYRRAFGRDAVGAGQGRFGAVSAR